MVKTNELEPTLKQNDIVIISKLFSYEQLKHCLVYIRDPYSYQARFSYVVGNEGDWVQHRNFNTLIRVPNGHIWNEPGVSINENAKNRETAINPSIGFIVKNLKTLNWNCFVGFEIINYWICQIHNFPLE